MAKSGRYREPEKARPEGRPDVEVPLPTLRFKLRAWREFQRALDPLAPPRPFPTRPQR